MIDHRINPGKEFENESIMAPSPTEIEFFLRNTLVINKPYIECREIIVYYKADLLSFFVENKSEYPYKLEIINKNVPTFSLTRLDKDDQKYSGNFIILKSSVPHLFRLISVCEGFFWNDVVKPFLKRKYPELFIIYFKQNELESSIQNFEKQIVREFSNKVNIDVVEITSKSERYSKEFQRRKYIDTERSWTNLSLAETFSDLQERGFWFTSLKFKIVIMKQKNGRVVQKSFGKVSKFGVISCTGLYNQIRDYLIEPLEVLAAGRMQLLEGRGIIEREYQPGPPLEIYYDEDVFSNTTQIRQFGELINHYHDASMVIYHGNPYFHASIADQKDGSSFEIWILSERRILISPQAKTSAQALSRFVTFIFNRFKEGSISEYAPGTE